MNHNFTVSDLKLFEQIAKLNEDKLKLVLANHLRKKYKKVIETPDYIFAEGNIPIALAAHLDTVFSAPPSEIYFDQNKGTIWSPQGLGADDRAGVFIILQILKTGMRPSIIFTTGEETGGFGAFELAKLDNPFPGLKYIIQLDRHGSDDCVFYDCNNNDFVDYIESFGYIWNFGTYTDICELCPSWGVAGVNLSVGYRNEHSCIETLFVRPLMATLSKVKKMLADCENVNKFDYIPGNWYNPQNYLLPCNGNDPIKCNHCHKYYIPEDMFAVVKFGGKIVYYCPECLSSDGIAWCESCGNPYEKLSPEAPDTGLCDICAELGEKNVGIKTAN